jgi:hypothetical protein
MGVLIRIGLRYGAGILVAKGLISAEFGDMVSWDDDISSMIEIGLGGVSALAAEGWYLIAKRFGWST